MCDADERHFASTASVFPITPSGDTAMLSLALRNHHITAAAPISYDFDPYEDLARPGGILIGPLIDPYGLLLKKGAEDIRTKSDWYLYHEHLEEINEPIYFHQFVERAAAKGLQFLGESNVAVMSLEVFPAELQQELVFTAALAADTRQANAAREFIGFLTGPAAGVVFEAKGMKAG